jgi:hypothetical protein
MSRSFWLRLFNNLRPGLRLRRDDQPRKRVRLLVERLEDRLTPTNFAATLNGSTLVLTKTAKGNGGLTITRAATFAELTVTTTTGTINDNLTSYTPPTPISAVSIVLGKGNDTVSFDGTSTTGNGEIDLAGSVTIAGSSGNKTITAQSMRLHAGGFNINLPDNGAETSTFTDVDVGGLTTINHPGVGNTSLTITSSGTPNTLNNWGGLTITNGQGADTNAIADTNFAGSVTITNGAGESRNIGQNGGSLTTFSALNDKTQTLITGNLTITTATGQSDTEVHDYSVEGNVTIDTGGGFSRQSNANFVGLENVQTFPGSGIPVVGGSVTITAATRPSVSPGLVIDLGTGATPASLPLVIDGNLGVTAEGNGMLAVNDTAGTVLGNVTLALQNTGDESVTFTDSSVQGTTKITHPNPGNTDLTITTSGTPNTLNTWGSLALIDGAGSDTNTINDTNFAGAVSIANGPGQDGNIGQYGGSFTTFSALNNKNLTTITGNLIITTANGQSDTEIHDYNVLGSVTVNTGAGFGGQAAANFVGLENVQTFATSAIPVIGGSIKIAGTARPSVSPGLVIDLGTGSTPASLPLIIDGNLTVSATGTGALQINDTAGTLLGNATLSLKGTGGASTIFTDTNVRGVATVSHPGAGNTIFTITTSGSPNTQNTWGSLTINDGAGADANTINDTNFAGNVTINNGPGAAGDIGLNDGSLTVFAASHDANLATISGSLAVTTASGQSDTELYDYNVHGNVTINTGPGIQKQASANFVGLENNRTFAATGAPVIGGNVSILGMTLPSVTPGLMIDAGTGTNPGDFPLVIAGTLTINATGAGAVAVDLNDLRVPVGATTVTLGAGTSNDTLGVQSGTGLISAFAAFSIVSLAGGNNTFSIQDQAGETDFAGAINLQFGPGADTLNLGADSGNTSGVTGAIVKLFSTSLLDGGSGQTNSLFEGGRNANAFFTSNPQLVHF